MSDEQRVRTMCGWIGVEIARSRVRTPGKAGYGLYRVRGAELKPTHVTGADGLRETLSPHWEPTGWTAYVLGLGAIESAVEASIRNGSPSGPGSFITGAGVVPTRWTSAYRGSRRLGLSGGAEAAGALVGAGLDPRPVDMPGVEASLAQYEPEVRDTIRQRRRAANVAFQAEHAPARAAGLEARHGAKLRRNAQSRD